MTDSSMRKHGKVAVLMGGNSAEREVSLMSGNAVLLALQQSAVNAEGFDPAHKSMQALKNEHFDRALVMLHGRGGEDGSIQGSLQFLGIPYTGSGVLGSALAMDKGRSKALWRSLGLPTADYEVVTKKNFDASHCNAIMQRLGDTIMVKPTREGSSIGMAKVTRPEQLAQAVQKAFAYDREVLLERFIQGDEFTVAVLQGQSLPSISMRTPRDFYDYEAKYQANSTEYFCPSGLSETDEQQLGDLAVRAFQALDCSGWGRVDLMRSDAGAWYLLEANTVPGMTSKSLVPMAAKQRGMDFNELCLAILATADGQND